MFKKNLQKLLLSSCCLLYFGAGVSAEPMTFQSAVAEYKSGKYQSALSMFRAFSATNPNNALVHYYMALCHHQLGHVDQAKQEYQTVISSGDVKLKQLAESGLGKVSGARSSGAGGASPSSISSSPSGMSGSQTSSAQKAKKVIEFYADW